MLLLHHKSNMYRDKKYTDIQFVDRAYIIQSHQLISRLKNGVPYTVYTTSISFCANYNSCFLFYLE